MDAAKAVGQDAALEKVAQLVGDERGDGAVAGGLCGQEAVELGGDDAVEGALRDAARAIAGRVGELTRRVAAHVGGDRTARAGGSTS